MGLMTTVVLFLVFCGTVKDSSETSIFYSITLVGLLVVMLYFTYQVVLYHVW